MKGFSITVWLLGLISFFTDMASELLYPVMPLYLSSIGYSVWFIGLLEGIAEALAGWSKGYFGKLSDDLGKRLPFVRWGYGLSAIAKPCTVLFTNAWWIFFTRSSDRLGKGLRSGARDAMLAAEATKENKARVFGFHRAMDTLGAALGPSLALAFLYFYPGQYRWLFACALLPGLAALASTWWLRESAAPTGTKSKVFDLSGFWRYWQLGPPLYKRYASWLLVFTLFNSSDTLLLLRAKELGCSDTSLIGVYIFFNLVYALAAYPAGILADKLGIARMLAIGMLLFALVYASISFSLPFPAILGVFGLYGLYAACHEGLGKALLSNTIPKEEQGTALGAYAAGQSLASFAASAAAGWCWWYTGSAMACFLPSALAALLVGGLFLWNSTKQTSMK
jgi:MFS family permease